VVERLFAVFPSGAFCAPVYRWLHVHGCAPLEGEPWFLNLAGLGRSVEGVLYVDIVHYSAMFCRAIAESLARKLCIRTDGERWREASVRRESLRP
jgi:hypothetical protein